MTDDTLTTATVAKARPENRNDNHLVQVGSALLRDVGVADGERIAVGGDHFEADEDMGSTGLVRTTWRQRDALGVEIGDSVPLAQPEGEQPLGVGGVVEPADDETANPNHDIEGATWNAYHKKRATWAAKLPVDVTVPTSHGEVEAEAGDYLCINPVSGSLYPCDGESFEEMYEETDWDVGGDDE